MRHVMWFIVSNAQKSIVDIILDVLVYLQVFAKSIYTYT